jgi:hypothetical protein
MHITSIFVSICDRSIEVEVPCKHPYVLCLNMQIVEPINKTIPVWTIARAIYGRENPDLLL